jgi:DUF1707 SHOCT-like domain
MIGPGDEVAGGPGYLRASDADREQVIDTLKVAFMQGRLTRGELDVELGQALAARTYAQLAAVIADIPAGSGMAHPPKSARAQLHRPRNKSVNSGLCVILAATLAASVFTGVVAGGAAAVIVALLMLNLAALATRP